MVNISSHKLYLYALRWITMKASIKVLIPMCCDAKAHPSSSNAMIGPSQYAFSRKARIGRKTKATVLQFS